MLDHDCVGTFLLIEVNFVASHAIYIFFSTVAILPCSQNLLMYLLVRTGCCSGLIQLHNLNNHRSYICSFDVELSRLTRGHMTSRLLLTLLRNGFQLTHLDSSLWTSYRCVCVGQGAAFDKTRKENIVGEIVKYFSFSLQY